MTPNTALSIKARLLAEAKSRNEEFERTLTRYAAERFLYRLGESSARGRCILKGASLLQAWLPDPFRATRDVDLLAFGESNDAAIQKLVEDICSVACTEDGLVFDLSELMIDAIRPEEEYSGKRARFIAYLGKARISVQLDIGFGDALYMPPEEIKYPTLLRNLPEPCIRAYPKEVCIAEKLDAMIRLDTRNSRMKDFHDVWALSHSFPFTGRSLGQAISTCFERRDTNWIAELPRFLTSSFYREPDMVTRWRSYLAAGSILIPPPSPFEVIGERIISFIGPIQSSHISRVDIKMNWLPGGPWK